MPLPTSNPRNSLSLGKAASVSSETQLGELAYRLAQELKLGDRVFLEGPMGAGKSTFARYLLAALGILQPAEGSPTFAIAHEYEAPVGGIVHIDFYRIRSEDEIDEAGIPAYYWERNLIVISEWLSSWPEFMAQIEKDFGMSAGDRDRGRIWRVDLDFVGSDTLESTGRRVTIRGANHPQN